MRTRHASKIVGLLALVSTVAGATPPSQSDLTFAVECSGSANSTSNMSGPQVEKTSDLGKQVYVFDQKSNKIFRALIPRQQLDPVCGIPGDESFVSMSPGLLLADSHNAFGSEPYNTCSFEVSRLTGQGHQTLRMEWKGGRFHEFKWMMTCVKTKVPVFDLTKRRF